MDALKRGDEREAERDAARRSLGVALDMMAAVPCGKATKPGHEHEPCAWCLFLGQHGKGPLASLDQPTAEPTALKESGLTLEAIRETPCETCQSHHRLGGYGLPGKACQGTDGEELFHEARLRAAMERSR